MYNSIEKSILQTLAYFDLFNYPLTPEELFVYLWKPPQMRREDCEMIAKNLAQKRNIGNKNGYYFLAGRENIIADRERGQTYGKQKIIKAGRAARLIREVPFLKAIFISSSVAAGTALPSSDIDFFIITETKRIWLVRFFTNLILRLLGLRVYGSKIKDKICLCYFVDTDHLNMAPVRTCEEDIHNAYWLHQMLPIYDPQNYYARFIQANRWTERLLPNIRGLARDATGVAKDLDVKDGKIGKVWKNMWQAMWRGAYGGLLESQAKGFLMGKLKYTLKEKAKLNNNNVILGEGIIKLHEHDTRREVRERWEERCFNYSN